MEGRSTAHRPAIVDPTLDRHLLQHGYAVVRLVDATTAEHMRATFGALHGWSRHQLVEHQPPDFEISVWDRDPDYQAAVGRLVDRHAGPAIEQVFATHRTVARSIMVKWPAAHEQPPWTGVPDCFHADATCVDERAGARGYRMWLALQDVTADQGGLEVVPGSHRVRTGIRGWGVEPAWLAHEEVLAARAVPIALRAGEALVFEPALVHRSGPNRSDVARVAVSVLLVEPDEPLCVFRRRDDHSAERVAIDASFFSDGTYNDLDDLPGGEIVAIDDPQLSPSALAAALDREVAQPG